MKKIISFVLVLTMIFTLFVYGGTTVVNAMAESGVLTFDTESVPVFTPGTGDAPQHTFTQGDYKFSGRVSHASMEWSFEENALGKKGYSVYGVAKSGVTATSDKQNDPCLAAYVDITNPVVITDTNKYYIVEFDMATTGATSFEMLATTTAGQIIVPFSKGKDKKVKSDFFRQSNGVYVADDATWHNYKLVIKPADVTAKDGDANDITVEEHEYWIYANGILADSGKTMLKKRNTNDSLTYFEGLNRLEFRGYGITKQDDTTKLHTTTAEWGIRLDNISTSVADELPGANFEASMDFDTLTETTDMDKINSELWATQTGHFISGTSGTYIRTSEKGLAAVEGGLFGKADSDKAISLWLDGNQTNGTHFMNVKLSGYDYKGLHRMQKGDFYELQTYMAWDADAQVTGIQGFYDNEVAGNDGKGPVAINVTPSSGIVYALGKTIDGIILEPSTWYKFNLVVHSGDAKAQDDEDKNWFKLYINDVLVADKVVFTPTLRNNVQTDTFLGIDQYWLQVGVGKAQTSGKVYYDDFKVSYTGQEPVIDAPSYIGTTDEYAMLYLGDEANVFPGVNNYIDERVNLDSDKWFTSDGAVVTIKNPSRVVANNYYSITGNGKKIFGNLKNSYSELAGRKTFSEASELNKEFNYAAKDFTTHSFGSYIGGRDFEDYSFRMDTVNVYDNWVKVLEDDGETATSAEYQRNPENWIDKADIPEGKEALYKFRDSYNPFVQIFPGTHFSNGVKEDLPWSVAFSMYTSGEYNTADFQVISDDNSERVITNILTLDQVHGNVVGVAGKVIQDEKGNPLKYNDNQWHDVVVNVYPKANKIDVVFDGKVIYSGEDTFPWERLARVKFQHAFGAMDKENARTGTLAVDDLYFYRGSRYQGANIEIKAEGAFDDKYIDGGIITATAAATASDLSGITEVNGKGITKQIFQSNDYGSENGDDITSGNILLVRSSDGRQFRYYYLADVEEKPVVQFTSAPDYILEETNLISTEISTNTVIKGKIFAASYEDVGTAKKMLKCTDGSLDDAKYRYDGNKLSVKVPALYLGVDESVSSVKLFITNENAYPICSAELNEQ